MFHSARLKLTAWYLLIIMTVSILFSGIIYQVLTLEINRFDRMHRLRIQEQLEEGIDMPIPPGPQRIRTMFADPELIEETKQRVLSSLLILNGSILVISGVLGYMLAGRTLKPIQEMTDEQKRFISDASHEIKTPLTSLKTAFEVFLRSKKKTIKEAEEIIEDSIAEVDKLQSLSDALLKLSNFEKPNPSVMNETISIEAVIKKAVKKTSYLAKTKNITITQNIQTFSIKGNQDSIVDLLVIILDNAIKYSHERSTIEVQTNISASTGSIEIRDHGIGIDETDLKHIFERFYRSDTARTKSNRNGYGLGLSIAKKIVSLHKGHISASSKPGKGTTVTIQFPLVRI